MQYKIIVDKQSRTNPSTEKREYAIDIEELRTNGRTSDSLVIAQNESYVMRRLAFNEYYVLKEIEEPIKEVLENPQIELFEGDNYIYLIDMVGNKFYAEYLIKNNLDDKFMTEKEARSAIDLMANQIEISVNEKLTSYSTTEEMNALIKLLSDEINLEVSKKVNEEDITGAKIMLAINDDISDIQISADKIDINGKAVKFKTETSSSYTYTLEDAQKIIDYRINDKPLTQEEIELYDLDGDGIVNLFDAQRIISLVNNNNGKNEGSFEIDPYSAKRCLIIKNYKDEVIVSLGNYGLYANYIKGQRIDVESITLEGDNGKSATVSAYGIDAPSVSVNGNQLGVTQTERTWHDASNGVYHYEGEDVGIYNLPSPYCQVWVARSGGNRGTAIAINWNDDGGTKMWINRLHDDTGSNNWAGWVEK